jgi:hypothetical protein
MKRVPDPNPQVERILQQRDNAIEANMRLHNISQRQLVEDKRTIENFEKHIAPVKLLKNKIIESMKDTQGDLRAELQYLLTQSTKNIRSEITEKLDTEDMTDYLHDFYVSTLGDL